MSQSQPPAAASAAPHPQAGSRPSPSAAGAAAPTTANGESYDVVVIGAGPGGYIAAFEAARLGLRAAVVERQWVGGVCTHVGCIPSKALLRNAEVVRLFKEAKAYGIEAGEVRADYAAAVDRSRQVVERSVRGLDYLFRKHQVDLVRGEAKLVARDTVAVGDRQLETRHVVVATGARPRDLPNMPIDGERVVTSWQLIEQRDRPEHLVIVGGGVIGVEMGTVFRSYGSQVTILELLDRLLPREDERVGALLRRSFERQGFTVHTGVQVESARREGDKAQVVFVAGGARQTLDADRCLVAASIAPNSDGLGLEALGVQLERGWIKVDDRMATNVPGVWAIGDVVGRLPLAHVASAEGIQVAHAIAGKETRPLKYTDMPRPIFSYPQVAAIGLTEAQAREAGHQLKIGEFPFSASGKARAENETEGAVKVVVDARYGEILGCHIVGPDATEILAQITPYKVLEGTTRELIETVVAHPTLAEAVKHAVEVAEGEALEI